MSTITYLLTFTGVNTGNASNPAVIYLGANPQVVNVSVGDVVKSAIVLVQGGNVPAGNDVTSVFNSEPVQIINATGVQSAGASASNISGFLLDEFFLMQNTNQNLTGSIILALMLRPGT